MVDNSFRSFRGNARAREINCPYHLPLLFTVCYIREKTRKELKRQIKELEEINSFTCYAKQDDSLKATEEERKHQQEEQKLLDEQTRVLHTFRDDNKTVRIHNITVISISCIDNGDASRTTQGQ